MTSRTCPACLTPLPEEAKFCLECGTPTPITAGGSVAPDPPDQVERLTAVLGDRYSIEGELGRGGMATVYFAEDVKHRRKVALKVMRPKVASTLGAERFLREIEIAARLAHPHILPVHDSGDADGFLYYVMPLLEGETLRSRLVREGELPIQDVVRIVRDVADALSYAHTRGVVHRDVKPDNVMLTGRHALVMDFGVAKAVREASAGQTLTTIGVSLGTPAYMAPEQAAGDEHLDHRADIYALGVVAYELLAGQPPFSASTPQAVMTKHITEEPPPIADRRKAVPEPLANLVMRALSKKAADRWQSAEDFLRQLELLATPSGGIPPVSGGQIPVGRSPKRVLAWGAGAAAVLVAVVGLAWGLASRSARSVPSAVPATFDQLTLTGDLVFSGISPDGQYLAYTRSTPGEPPKLWVEQLGVRGDPIEVLPDGLFSGPFRWSSDGKQILFQGGDTAGAAGWYRTPFIGGRPELLVARGAVADVSADGAQLVFGFTAVKRLMFRGGSPSDTSSIDLQGDWTFLQDVAWGLGGDHLAVLTNDQDGNRTTIWSVAADGSRQVALVEDSVALSSPVWSGGGDAVYYLRPAGGTSQVWKVGVNEDGAPDGPPRALVSGLVPMGNRISVSADGERLVYTRSADRANLKLFTLDPSTGVHELESELTRGTSYKSEPRVSPDGTQIAFTDGPAGSRNVFVMPIEGGTPVQRTDFDFMAGVPAWSPDSRLIGVAAGEPGQARIWTMAAQGSGGPREYAETHVSPTLDVRWSPSDRIMYQRPGNRNWHFLDPRTSEEAPLVPNDSVGWIFAGSYVNRPIAPDQSSVVMMWNRSPNRGMWRISLTDTAQTFLWPPQGHVEYWAEDSESVYWHAGGPVQRRTFDGATHEDAPIQWPEGCAGNGDYTPDRRRVVCHEVETSRDVWLIENFDPDIGR